MRSVSTKELADILKISERRVQQLAKDGILMRSDDGNFNLPDSVEGYLKFKTESGNVNFDREHALLEKAKREKTEIALAKLKGSLLRADDVEHLISGMIITCKTKLLSIPMKCAPRLLNCKCQAKIVGILEDAVYEALNELHEMPAKDVSAPANSTGNAENCIDHS